MEQIYAFGVTVIEFVQYWFSSYEDYFMWVNDVSNPNHSLEVLFPLVSVVDSVFAAQLVLCIAFGSWLNAVAKWWLLEHRPYWWVRETDYYTESQRPVIRQFRQTCETGPGCPSGHSEITAMLAMLLLMWIVHIMNDRKVYYWWWKHIAYPLCGVALGSVMFARMFVGTHFPHQVFAGAMLGGFLAPALCIYVADPYIWQYGFHSTAKVSTTVFWHVASVAVVVAISVLTYYSLMLCGFDPMWTVKMAFRWCEQPEHIHVSTTPMYALAHSTGHLLGWALTVTPAVARYRHYTKSRSLIIAVFAAGIVWECNRRMKENIPKDSAFLFYIIHFLVCAIKVPVFLHGIPYLASWPYSKEKIA